MSKNETPTKVIVPCRFSYLHCWEPEAINGGEPKYSVSAIIPKSDKETIKKIQAAVEAAKQESLSKWGGKIPPNLKLPLRDGDIDRPEDEAYKGCYFFNARDGLTYEGVGENKKWERMDTYGPKLVENIVQGTSRDILAEAMMRLKKAGFSIVFHVHDEAVLEVPEGESSVEEVCRIMAEQPSWVHGLPLRADGYECQFYKKD